MVEGAPGTFMYKEGKERRSWAPDREALPYTVLSIR